MKLCTYCDFKSNLRAWQSQNIDGPSSRAVCCSYGESAWWWEAEELVRKLLLTAVAVLLDAGSPLQACGHVYVIICFASVPGTVVLVGRSTRCCCAMDL